MAKKKKMYKTSGNDKIGHRLIIPSHADIAMAYYCTVKRNGTLIYTPVIPRGNPQYGV